MDIVERLREKTKSLEWLQKMGGSDKHVLVIMSDAADEIERLREALRNIAMRGPDGELWNTKAEIWMIADAALQQKDSE